MTAHPMAGIVAALQRLAPGEGYTATPFPGLRILRSSAPLRDIPVLYRPGAVFVCQGRKRGFLGDKVIVYDARHYLAVSVPVPFRMESDATPDRPLFALYLDFDLTIAADLLVELDALGLAEGGASAGLASTPMDADIVDTLRRLMSSLSDPRDLAILGPALSRELHYRVLISEQGAAMRAALSHKGPLGKIARVLQHIQAHHPRPLSVAALAAEAGMSVAAFHVHFRETTHTSPMQYVKSVRLHRARLLVAQSGMTVSAAAATVGYVSTSQFSRDFKRLFGRPPSEETRWVRDHLGDGTPGR